MGPPMRRRSLASGLPHLGPPTEDARHISGTQERETIALIAALDNNWCRPGGRAKGHRTPLPTRETTLRFRPTQPLLR
jgi:hypothetical protein